MRLPFTNKRREDMESTCRGCGHKVSEHMAGGTRPCDVDLCDCLAYGTSIKVADAVKEDVITEEEVVTYDFEAQYPWRVVEAETMHKEQGKPWALLGIDPTLVDFDSPIQLLTIPSQGITMVKYVALAKIQTDALIDFDAYLEDK